MNAVPTQACVKFDVDGPARVEAFIRLNDRSHIYCHTYGESAPILAIDDAHVQVSFTVPDTRQVTGEDLAWARLLAEAATRYVAELEQLAAANRESPAGPGAASGQAA